MTNQNDQYARRMARGSLLSHLYILQEEGLCDPATPRTADHAMINMMGAKGMLPPPDLMLSSLRWMEGAGYVTVDWAMDDHRSFESVTITQKAIDLYEHKDARKMEPGVLLPPRR